MWCAWLANSHRLQMPGKSSLKTQCFSIPQRVITVMWMYRLNNSALLQCLQSFSTGLMYKWSDPWDDKETVWKRVSSNENYVGSFGTDTVWSDHLDTEDAFSRKQFEFTTPVGFHDQMLRRKVNARLNRLWQGRKVQDIMSFRCN